MAMNLRLPDPLNERFKQLAEQDRSSVHALLIKAAEEYAARRSTRALVDAAAADIRADYADALRRLAQ